MPSNIIPTEFGIVPTKGRAKKHPRKGAKCFPFNLLLIYNMKLLTTNYLYYKYDVISNYL